MPLLLLLLVLPFEDVEVGEGPLGDGYSHFAPVVWDAMTATSLPFPEARCAFMKTRRVARKEESGRVG